MSFPIYQISVSRNGNELVISDPVATLPADAAVQWIVTGVQRDETVLMLAEASSSDLLSPFTFSRRSQGIVWARGNAGLGGIFEYSLVVYKLGRDRSSSEQAARSGKAALVVNASSRRNGQTILVGYNPLDNTLVVDQLATHLVNGDPLLFEFFLPKDLFGGAWVPSLFFIDTADSLNSGYGPFSTLSVVEGPLLTSEGDGTMVRRFLMATGTSGRVGSFQYQAVVHSVDGKQIVSSPDPVIDNDGEVVCPGC